MDKAFFSQGETLEQFLAHMGETRAKFEQFLKEAPLDKDHKTQLDGLPKEVNVLVIAEEWSGDVLYFLPVLARMVAEAGWNVRIFHRDDYPDLILPYRKDDLYHSVPVFVFYDGDFNELGHWIERPASATKVIDEESLKLRRQLRETHRLDWQRDAVGEVAAILGKD